MYCPECNKEGVDFNSVAVTAPKRAITMDTDGPVDLTSISSSSHVVNVCKNCGCQNLFSSRQALNEAQKRQEKKGKTNDQLILFITIGLGLVGALVFGSADPYPGSDMANWGPVGSGIVGFLVCGGSGFVIGIVCLAFMQDN